MTPEAQRIAIAEACGRCPHTETEYYCVEDGNSIDTGFTCKKCGENPHSAANRLPNYLSDLNAMHEAEKVLKLSNQQDYLNKLLMFAPGKGEHIYWPLTHATAAQRAEAFLRTIGKWGGLSPKATIQSGGSGENK